MEESVIFFYEFNCKFYSFVILNKFQEEYKMTIEISNDYGKIDISNEVIASVVGSKAVESYGIVGMASRQQVRDGIAEILGHENYARGIEVKKTMVSLI